MTTEEKLKTYILSRYPTMKDFSFACGVKYTTLLGMFTRGLNNANISNVIAVCKTLGIDADALAEGEIMLCKPEDKIINLEEIASLIHVKIFEREIMLDGEPLTRYQAEFLNDMVDMTLDLLRRKKC